jgi:hypothetical protein
MQMKNEIFYDQCAADLSFLDSSLDEDDNNETIPDSPPDLVESSDSSSSDTDTPPPTSPTALQRMMDAVNNILMGIRSYHGIKEPSDEATIEPKDLNDTLCIHNNLEQEMQERTREQQFQYEEAEHEMNFWLQRIVDG